MRKVLLLCFTFAISFYTQAQKDTVFLERFDPPSGPDLVTNGSYTTTTNAWSTKGSLYTSAPQSYHIKATKTIDSVYFETDPFSTVGKPFVGLSFNHIAKLFPINQARIQISVDGGVTWQYLSIQQYKGNDQVFNATGWFNASSHVNFAGTITPWQPGQNGAIPDQSWWKSEYFDLTGKASDTTTMTGYPDVRLRFLAIFRLPYNAPAQPPEFSAGWYVDDVMVTAGPCEQNPPTISFDYNPSPCYLPNPQGEQPLPSDSCIPVGAIVRDVMAFYDTGVDSAAVFYTINGGPMLVANVPELMPPGIGLPNERKGFICGLSIGDTIDYYIRAWDKSCPSNTNRRPSSLVGSYQFYIKQSLPMKCGDPNCGLFPEVIKPNPTWTESFDNTARWIPGTGNGNQGMDHRGTFPVFPEGAWVIAPPPLVRGFGWSIRSGPTGTAFTGPDNDHTLGPGGGGQYIYLEASQTPPPSNNSRLVTPCIDLTTSNTCKAMDFYYHMFGDDIGELWVHVDTGSNTEGWQPNALIKIIGEQQSSSTDAWKRGIVDLTDYNGQMIRLRFWATKGGGSRGDIAIDDIRIYEPDNVEIEVLASDYPENGYCDYGMDEKVNIHIRNNGCLVANNIPVAYSVNGGPPVVETITGANLGLGDDTNYVFSTGADLSLPGIYNLKVWVAMPGDTLNENDTILGPEIENYLPITSFPYIMDFETGTPGTKNLGTNDLHLEDGLDPAFHWQVGEDLTPTRETGPYAGHYFGGNYLYTTTVSPAGGVTSTYLRTVCVDLQGLNNPTLDFLFHNYTDAGFDKVEVQVSRKRENSETWTTIPGSNVGSKTSDSAEFSNWVLKRVNLSAYKDSIIQIRFKATRTATSSSKINFAIDNVTIYDLITQDAGALHIPEPFKRGSINSNLDPKVAIANYGTNVINGFTVNLEVTPLCGPNQGQPTLYTQTYTNTIQPAQNQVVTLDSPNIVWPQSECRVCFYPTVSGDTYAFNDTVCKNIVIRSSYDIPAPFDPTIDAFNFDDCNYSKDGFFPHGGLLQWELGTPTYGISPRTAPNSWVTDLDNPYLVGTTEYLYLPRFSNFDTIVSAQIRFFHKFNFGNVSNTGIFDAAGTIQYYDSTTSAYEVLGADRITFNERNIRGWWSSQIGALKIDLFGDEPGWVGSTNLLSPGGNYIPSWYRLSEFNYANSNFELDMRFVFKTKNLNQGAASYGWSIDDFQIYVPPQNSVAPIRVRYINPLPFPYTDQPLRLWIQNTGAKVVDDYKVEVLIDGVSLGVQQRNINNSLPGISQFRETVIHAFKFDYDWPASMVTPGPHEVCIITSRPNSKQDNYVPDDTLCVEMVVLQEFDMTSIGDSVYCNDFEGTDPDITPWLTTNTNPFSEYGTSWEYGVPQQVDSAHSGFYTWMTNLDSNYLELDASSLYTPVFIVDSGLKYTIDFHHWFQTEKHHDGGNVEVSYDEGFTWYPIGYSIKKRDTIGVYKNNWYNTPFVTALDQIRGGWTDTSGGWMNSFWRMSFLDDVRVVFRFRFGSDYSVQDAGWAIDDFCFHKTNEDTDQDIGEDEFVLPDEIMIGELAPNPATNQAQLAFHFPAPNDMKITVYNVVGQLMESRENRYHQGVHILDFDTSDWTNGIYLVNLEYEGQSVTKKLIVSH